MCLKAGLYSFTIYDILGDGIIPTGYYNVTTASGELIVKGGEFEQNETTTFSLPLPNSFWCSPSNEKCSELRLVGKCFPTVGGIMLECCNWNTSAQ